MTILDSCHDHLVIGYSKYYDLDFWYYSDRPEMLVRPTKLILAMAVLSRLGYVDMFPITLVEGDV